MPGVCFQGIRLSIISCILPLSENTSAENHNSNNKKKWLDLEDVEFLLVTFDFQEENYWTKSLIRRNWVLPDNFIAPFLQLWEFFSLSLIANCYGPYNLWLTLIHVNAALSRRFWPLWFSTLFLIQCPGFNCNSVGGSKLYLLTFVQK